MNQNLINLRKFYKIYNKIYTYKNKKNSKLENVHIINSLEKKQNLQMKKQKINQIHIIIVVIN